MVLHFFHETEIAEWVLLNLARMPFLGKLQPMIPRNLARILHTFGAFLWNVPRRPNANVGREGPWTVGRCNETLVSQAGFAVNCASHSLWRALDSMDKD